MSNDQTNNNFITPIILSVSSSINQAEIATEFIREDFGWDLTLNSPQLKIINQDQETISIENIRDITSELSYASHLGKPRAFILIAADQLSAAAQHAFLKSLEEPPANTLLLLVSSAKNKLLSTILSRCISRIHSSTTESISLENLPTELEDLLNDSKRTSYKQLIELSNKYKDRDQALQIIQQLLFIIQQQRTNTKQKVKLQSHLLNTLSNLHANTNVRLALEDCFFTLKRELGK
ncbi:MAG: hypothetical protein HN846_04355 [Candidatus Pacebacteria bacterium]|jgi:DNA polymerase III subunit delta'|nr:hypothetical protein [Candidatus Paceibacterota bacterium]MBT3511938.1 hypothetical protein [Candidatus Paceibacterota bacterium]MBT4005260.1 hypothetical protein [Candidatus Paceibacterota bacterium]MBT4358980.1 hypothetical protein [Candidatus Paceibacterota bacterium]MBT4680455.1 hypothetical protein [Candidatus Paceibacterota bacterium]